MSNSSVFTEHVRALEPGAPPLPADQVASVWRSLRGALVAELRRRGLWQAPPAYLGVFGADRWSAGGALDELLTECYASVFLERLRSLHAQLEVRVNIDGLIFRNVRNFLHDTQRKHDPLGFRVFNVLRAAVSSAVADGHLVVLEGDPEIRNASVLSASQLGDPKAAAAANVADPVASWNNELLPDLVTALGKAQQRLVARLRDRLVQWSESGVESFRFGDLCTALKRDARRRWGGVWRGEGEALALEETEHDLPTLVRQIQPDTGFEDRDSFAKLLRCVSGAIDRAEGAAIAGSYLRRLWTFLRCWATDNVELPVDGDGVKLPSGRKLAGLIDIPRDRLPALRATLGQIVEDCRGQFRKPLAVPVSGASASPPEWSSAP